MATSNQDARLNFKLSQELKQTIKAAAASLGQSVNDFAVSTLVQTARRILNEKDVTHLSDLDRQLFAEMLDDENTGPNSALTKAAKLYRKQSRLMHWMHTPGVFTSNLDFAHCSMTLAT